MTAWSLWASSKSGKQKGLDSAFGTTHTDAGTGDTICGQIFQTGVPGEYKITAMDGENISFRYRDYKNSPDRRNPVEKELTLHYREFFPRLLQHVPLRYFRIVRYYGFYSNKGSLPEEYFGQDES